MLTPPLIDRPNMIVGYREWSGRSGLLLTPKLVDDRSGRTNLAFLRGRPRSRERFVQGLTFVLRQIVPLVVDDQVKLSAIGQRRWLVEAQPPVLDTCTQRSHVTTLWRQQAYRQAGNRAARTARRASFDEAVTTVKEAVADAHVEVSQEEGAVKTAVLNSLTSASGQRTYEHAIREFVANATLRTIGARP